MHLSEAPNRELRMADLANATDLSASRMTRLVDDLQSRGLVTKTASSADARGNVARLTPRGMAKVKSAWPVHLASVRHRFFDCMDAGGGGGSSQSIGRGSRPPRGRDARTTSEKLAPPPSSRSGVAGQQPTPAGVTDSTTQRSLPRRRHAHYRPRRGKTSSLSPRASPARVHPRHR